MHKITDELVQPFDFPGGLAVRFELLGGLPGDQRPRESDAVAQPCRADPDMVRRERFGRMHGVLTRSGDRIEDHGNGCARGADKGQGVRDGLQIEDGGPAGDQHQVGRPGGFQRGSVGMGRGVEVEHFASRFPHALHFLRQATGVSRENDRQIGLAAIRPIGSGSLGIEVDHRRVAAGRGGSDGQVQGEGGFSRAPFLADDGDGFHRLIVHTFTCAHVNKFKRARVHE